LSFSLDHDSTVTKGLDPMQDYTVLYTVPGEPLPCAFRCRAADDEGAEQAFMKSSLSGKVVWTSDLNDPDAAMREYHAHSLLAEGDRVIWRDPDDDFSTGPAEVVSLHPDFVSLRSPSGSEIDAPYHEIHIVRPGPTLDEVKAEAERLTGQLKHLVALSLESWGNTPEDCQQTFLLNQILAVEQAINGVRDDDLKLTVRDDIPGLRVRVTPEAVRGDNCVPVEPPGRAEWFIMVWESRDLEVSDNGLVDDRAIELGDAPAWLRAWNGPFTVTLVDQVS
jgi:hypothetical protein